MEPRRGRPRRVPRPDRVRSSAGRRYGWLDAHLLGDGWLPVMGGEALAVYAFLCLVADRQGVSFWSRARMGEALGLDDQRLHRALADLEALGLVAYEPFCPGAPDGFRQVLAVPTGGPRRSSGGLLDELARRFRSPEQRP